MSNEQFTSKAKLIHGDKFGYELTECTKVKIICKVNGLFEQNASNHLRGFGCRFHGITLSKTTSTNDEQVWYKTNSTNLLLINDFSYLKSHLEGCYEI